MHRLPDPPDRPAVVTEACERAFTREFDFVYRVLQRFGASASDAEDLAQEVFCVMWRRRGEWDPRRPLRAWLAGVAFRVARGHQRRQREIPGGAVDPEAGQPSHDEQMRAAAARDLVARVLDALPAKDRAILVMHELEDLPMKEVARALSVPLFTGYSRLRAARKHFAREARRLQFVAEARQGGGKHHSLLLPPALLALERQRPGAPAGVRERVLRAVRAGPAAGASRGGSWVRRLPALAGAAAAVVSLVALSSRPAATGRAAATGAGAGAAGGAAVTTTALALKRVRPPSPILVDSGGGAGGGSKGREELMAARLGRAVVAYWRFDDGFGSEAARDVSGNGIDCWLRRLDPAGDWTDGVHAGALRLRNSGWLECPGTDSLDRLSTELTIAAWVQRPERQPHLRTIVSRQRGDGRGDDFYLGFVHGDLIFASDVWRRLRRPLPAMSPRWLHVAVTRHADGMVILYADGAELGRLRGPTASLNPGSRNPLLLGAAMNGPDPARADQKLLGAFDEVILYHRALAGDEVEALASGTQPRL